MFKINVPKQIVKYNYVSVSTIIYATKSTTWYVVPFYINILYTYINSSTYQYRNMKCLKTFIEYLITYIYVRTLYNNVDLMFMFLVYLIYRYL